MQTIPFSYFDQVVWPAYEDTLTNAKQLKSRVAFLSGEEDAKKLLASVLELVEVCLQWALLWLNPVPTQDFSTLIRLQVGSIRVNEPISFVILPSCGGMHSHLAVARYDLDTFSYILFRRFVPLLFAS